MNPELALQFAPVTELAAIAAYKWLGRGDKIKADDGAVEAMRSQLNQMRISGEIVIGEGEIDDAPMLYIGETLGRGGERVDIAVDPIDGTRMTAMGQSGAVAVLAVAEQGGLLKAPDMYMEKLVVGPNGKGEIDLSLPLVENIRILARASGKRLDEMSMVTLAKPRHQQQIEQLHKLGVRVFAIPDGDVAASILTCMPEMSVDIMYCLGGAPEGVISAAAVSALGGDMQARLVLRTEAKGDSRESCEIEKVERERCQQMQVVPDSILNLKDLVRTNNVIFSMTGITKGDLVSGVERNGDQAKTETLYVNGVQGSQSIIRTCRNLKGLSGDLESIIL